jgi:hypothetical protein
MKTCLRIISMAPEGSLWRQARSYRQSAYGMRGEQHAQAGQLREYSTFEQSDEGGAVHGAARKQGPNEAVWRHLPGQRLRSYGMRKYRYSELRGRFECGARLRRVDQQAAARAIDKEAVQSNIDGPLGLARWPVPVIAVNGSETVNAAGMSRDQSREIVVHGHDGFMRHMPVCIRDQVARYVDHPRSQMAVADIPQQKILVRQLACQHFPAGALRWRLRARCGELESRGNVMIVEVDNFGCAGHGLLACLQYFGRCEAAHSRACSIGACGGNAAMRLPSSVSPKP